MKELPKYAIRITQTMLKNEEIGQKFQIRKCFLRNETTIPINTTCNIGEFVMWPNASSHTPKIFNDKNEAKKMARLIQNQCDKFSSGNKNAKLYEFFVNVVLYKVK